MGQERHYYNRLVSGDILILFSYYLKKEQMSMLKVENHGNALQAAAHRGYLEIVQLLLEKGVDVNRKIGAGTRI